MEDEVLAGLASGLSDREIAERLQASTSTARTYTKRLLRVLGASNPRHALGMVRL